MPKNSVFRKYGFVWVTLFLFAISVLGHWLFAWPVFVEEQQAHGEEVVVRDFINQTMRDTFENWQSEFLQLIWQVAGLAFLWHIGSPQSKEGDDRKEEKIDLIVEALYKDKAKDEISKINKKYPKK